jgi:hypothetical protein
VSLDLNNTSNLLNLKKLQLYKRRAHPQARPQPRQSVTPQPRTTAQPQKSRRFALDYRSA